MQNSHHHWNGNKTENEQPVPLRAALELGRRILAETRSQPPISCNFSQEKPSFSVLLGCPPSREAEYSANYWRGSGPASSPAPDSPQNVAQALLAILGFNLATTSAASARWRGDKVSFKILSCAAYFWMNSNRSCTEFIGWKCQIMLDSCEKSCTGRFTNVRKMEDSFSTVQPSCVEIDFNWRQTNPLLKKRLVQQMLNQERISWSWREPAVVLRTALRRIYYNIEWYGLERR